MAIGNITPSAATSWSKPVPLPPGTRTDSSGAPIKNIMLLTVPDAEFSLLRPELEHIGLPHRYVLHAPGERIEFVYFPNDGMISLVVTAYDGRSVEVGLLGREGMAGTSVTLGFPLAPYLAITQIPGNAARIRADVLQEILPLAPRLTQEMHRFVLLQGLQMAQVAACNRLHELEQRLARWLLMCQDRVDAEILPLTHEFLAQMLGSGRPTVTLAAGMLERAGLIENMRGTIRVLNRKKLEDAACECYRVVQHFNGGLGLK